MNQPAAIARILQEKPSFHAWPDGTPANWSVAGDVLDYLAGLVQPGMNTLETGAGQTTLAFALCGANHTCITPDEDQAARIRAYLEPLEPEGSVCFIHRSSDEALPDGDGIPERLDIVLIDGAHRFPFPMIDWHYTQGRMPAGGIMVVDDYRMPSVRILYDFLEGEDDWELVKAFQTTAFFRKVEDRANVWDWADQKINKPHLDRLQERSREKSPPGDLLTMFRKLVGPRQ